MEGTDGPTDLSTDLSTSSPAGPGDGRSRHLDRFLTFVDAVVAIAITLLVLPLVELTGDLSEDDSVVGLLRDHASQVGAFLLSFVVIARLWTFQHRVMSPVREQDRTVSGLLLLWTLTIVVLPFPTALVAAAGGQVASQVAYVGTMALSSACLALVAVVLHRRPALLDDEPQVEPAHAWSTVAAFVVALVLMLVLPVLGYWPLLLLVVDGRVVDLVRGVGRRGGGRGSVRT